MTVEHYISLINDLRTQLAGRENELEELKGELADLKEKYSDLCGEYDALQESLL